MTTFPYGHVRELPSISLDVGDQAPGREALRELFPDHEPVWLSFVLVPRGDDIEVLLNQTEKRGLYVGKVGPRNREQLKAKMDGVPYRMRGLIEWASDKPKVKFIALYSRR